MDTLAVRLIVPLAGPMEDLHLQVTIQSPQLNRWCLRTTRPAGRTNSKAPTGDGWGLVMIVDVLYLLFLSPASIKS